MTDHRRRIGVSVITPTYHSRHLERAIRSIAEQDHPAIEYIIVDGGSDAETPELVSRFEHVVDRYIREPDRGQSDAINKGFSAATMPILAWLNADDYYFPHAVSHACEAFRADPELDVYVGDVVLVNEDGQFLRYAGHIEAHDPQVLLNAQNYIGQPAAFVRASALARVGLIDESLEFAMDWDLWCRMVRAGCRFRCDAVPLAVYRTHADTKTFNGGLPRLREVLRVNQRHKTGGIPWAFLMCVLRELPHVVITRWLPGSLRDRILEWVQRAKRRLYFHVPGTPSYGLYPHSQHACREARIMLPHPEDETDWIELSLSLPDGLPNQRVSVEVDGARLGTLVLQRGGTPTTRRFDLDTSDRDGVVELVLRAERVFKRRGRECCFRVDRLVLGAPPPTPSRDRTGAETPATVSS